MPVVRSAEEAQANASQSNHRHEDFQNVGGPFRVIFISELPGRPLPSLHNSA